MGSNFLKLSFFYIVIALISFSCAKIGAPQGGPEDLTPPKVVESQPPAYSTRFDGKKIIITFDEFVHLKDLNKYFVISPPMKKKPEVTVRGKSVVISLQEDLKPNTTYRFFLGDAIVDFHRDNPLRNFDFVLSTGDYIDSLALRGRVVNAFDNQPGKEGLFVMLYRNFNDSMPRKQLPDYITKSNEEGWFTLSHLRPDSFMIFALKDLNQNNLFDLPNEALAFSDTIIHFNNNYYLPNDSLTKEDTTKSDSLRKVRPPFKSQIILYSFTEDYEKQYLKKYTRLLPEKLEFIFNRLPYDSFKITPLNFHKENWLLPDLAEKNDTMVFWITDTTVVHNDTLKLNITYSIKDSLDRLIPRTDTISLTYKKPSGKKSRGETPQASANTFVISASTGANPVLDLNGKLFLMFSHPVLFIDKNKISFFKKEEEKQTPVSFTIAHDSIFLRKYVINFKMEPNYGYILTADSLAFTSIYQQVNDSTTFTFKTQEDDYYGTIKLTLSNVKEQMIVQLLDEKENIISQKITDKDQLIIFDFLPPGKFRIRAIYDRNRNKVWDTGNYAKKLQPEKVLYFEKVMPVKSNWDNEETWELE
jgi:hypothetical protein